MTTNLYVPSLWFPGVRLDAPLMRGCVGWWDFTSGGLLSRDLVKQSGRDAALTNMDQTNVIRTTKPNAAGNCVALNGTDETISITCPPEIDGRLLPMSVYIRARFNSTPALKGMFIVRGSAALGLVVYWWSYENNILAQSALSSSLTVNPDITLWHDWVFTIAYPYSGHRPFIYCDGVRIDAASAAAATPTVSPRTILIGTRGTDMYADMHIQQFAIWNRVLTPGEADQLHRSSHEVREPRRYVFGVTNVGSATSYTMTGPATGLIDVESTDFTVTPNGLYIGTVTLASNKSGTFSPTSLTWSGAEDAKTFTFTPSASGAHTISATSSPSVENPPPLTYTSVTGTIAIATPSQYTVFQRDANNVGDIAITGTYTGTCEAVEASFNGGPYATIDDSPSAGTYSGTLSDQNAGQGTLTVRFTNDHTVTASRTYVGIGDVFLVIGDSISEGRGTTAQSGTYGSLVSSSFRQDDAWQADGDPVDTGTNIGSHWPLLAQRIMQSQSVPVGFVTCGKGSTDFAGTHNEWAKNNAQYAAMVVQAAHYGGTLRGVLAHFGPNAVASSLSQAVYNAALDTLVANIQADVQAGVKLFVGLFGEVTTVSGDMNSLRYAIQEAWADNASVKRGPVLIDQNYSDGVHPKSNSELQEVADRWYASLAEALYVGSRGHGPTITEAKWQGKTVTCKFDCTLGGSIYTASAFRVTDDSGNRTIAAAVKSRGRYVTLTVSGDDLSGTVTVAFGEDNTAVGATIPTSGYVLPDASTVTLPAEPFIATATAGKTSSTNRVTLLGAG